MADHSGSPLSFFSCAPHIHAVLFVMFPSAEVAGEQTHARRGEATGQARVSVHSALLGGSESLRVVFASCRSWLPDGELWGARGRSGSLFAPTPATAGSARGLSAPRLSPRKEPLIPSPESKPHPAKISEPSLKRRWLLGVGRGLQPTIPSGEPPESRPDGRSLRDLRFAERLCEARQRPCPSHGSLGGQEGGCEIHVRLCRQVVVGKLMARGAHLAPLHT